MKKLPIPIRANPKEIKLTEDYFCYQEISRNPKKREFQAPTGKIEIVIPYDGFEFIPKSQIKKLRNRTKLAWNRQEKLWAEIGSLELANNSQIDLAPISEYVRDAQNIRLKIPVSGDGLSRHELLFEDQYSAGINYDYNPNRMDYIPINVKMKLFDEDLINIDEDLIKIYDNKDKAAQLTELFKNNVCQINLQPYLLLQIQVTISLPRAIAEKLSPVIKGMFINWPSITSSEALEIRWGNCQSIKEYKQVHEKLSPQTLHYNPLERRLEWSEVKFNKSKQTANPDLIIYNSDTMFLEIAQPGGLYNETELQGGLQIEIPDFLFSGLTPRFHDLTGELTEPQNMKKKTVFNTIFNLILDDALDRRLFFPFQQYQFDEVIPDEIRVSNIRTILTDRGFRIIAEQDLAEDGQTKLKQLIIARRVNGSKTFDLLVLLEGDYLEATRKAQIDGGKEYQSTFKSGTMKILFQGLAKGEYNLLMREMINLQKALIDSCECIRSRR